VRVLLDQNVPSKLRQSLINHEVHTAYEMGWAKLDDSDLLKKAESAGFDVMVTCDQNLPYQQNLKGLHLALIVLTTNNWTILKMSTSWIVQAVDAAQPGHFRVVAI
jgi:predicted nuclease of predicted toxin-antitoxin system